MWVGEDGRVIGSVTIGGCVDARVITESEAVLAGGAPRVIEMVLGDEDAWALGMTCGGAVQVLVEPVDATSPDDPVASAYEAVRTEIGAGRRAVLVSPLDARSVRLVVREDGSLAGTLGSEAFDDAARTAALDVMARGVSSIKPLEDGGPDAFLELHAPPLTAIVVGATHVAIPFSVIARELGWRTVIVDARERFATRERFPLADEILVGMPSEIVGAMRLDASTLLIVVAHDYKFDLPVLKAALAQQPAYIGLLGSRRRGLAILGFLRDEGVDEAQLARVRVPIGLDIGARSAAEIALSIASEALAAHTGRPGTPMRARGASTTSEGAGEGDAV